MINGHVASFKEFRLHKHTQLWYIVACRTYITEWANKNCAHWFLNKSYTTMCHWSCFCHIWAKDAWYHRTMQVYALHVYIINYYEIFYITKYFVWSMTIHLLAAWSAETWVKQYLAVTGRNSTGPPCVLPPCWVTLHMRVLQTPATVTSLAQLHRVGGPVISYRK